MPIPHSTGAKDYPLVGDIPTLVYLAQVASLELHVPQWRFDAGRRSRATADRLVLDLDPGPGVGLAECAEVARLGARHPARHGAGAVPGHERQQGHPPLRRAAARPDERAGVRGRERARPRDRGRPPRPRREQHGEESSATGKVLIDWSQNNGAKTTIAPYSLRGRAHPTVAAPRTWDELDDPRPAPPRLFDEVLERVETIGDPMAALGFHAGGREAEAGPLVGLHRQAQRAAHAGARAGEPARARRRSGRAAALRHPGAPRHAACTGTSASSATACS